jgi:hypothetical protein
METMEEGFLMDPRPLKRFENWKKENKLLKELLSKRN